MAHALLSERLSFPTPGVRPFALLTPERLSSSTFTFVGFSRARYFCVWRHPPVRQFQIARVFSRCCSTRVIWCHVVSGHRSADGMAQSPLSSLVKPWCCSRKHQAHNAVVLPPASTYRCKCPVAIVDTHCPLFPISTSGFTSSTFPVGSSRSHRGLLRRQSVSIRLDPSHRGLLPISHVLVDTAVCCFLNAPPGHHCVRLPFVGAVMYFVWLPRFCGCVQCS